MENKSVLDLINKKDKNTLKKKEFKNVFSNNTKKNKLSKLKNASISIYVDRILTFLIKSYIEDSPHDIRGESPLISKLFEQYVISILTNNQEGISYETMLKKATQFDTYIQQKIWDNKSFWEFQDNDLSEQYSSYSKLPSSGVNGGTKIVANFIIETKNIIIEEGEKEQLKSNNIGNLLLKSFFYDDLYFINELFGLDNTGLKEKDIYKNIKENNLKQLLENHLFNK